MHCTHVLVLPLVRQTGVPPEHVVDVCQVPVLSHVWRADPRQRFCPEMQLPAQLLL
jgi:hypothetical protein